MKMTIKTLAAMAAIAMSTPAMAADIGDNLIRSNVPTANGSAPGFLVLGEGYFVEAGYEDRITVEATVLPVGLNSKDLSAVLEYLTAAEIDASPRLAKKDRDVRSAGFETVAVVDDAGDPVLDANGDPVTEQVERFATLTTRVQNGGW